MVASTVKVWQAGDDASSEGSSAWVGVLLFLCSAVISVKSLSWLAATAAGYIMQ